MSKTLRYQFSYRRNLPHIQPAGATFFVTFRLAGSLPAAVLGQLQAELEEAKQQTAEVEDETERARETYRLQRRHFGRWDGYLDRAASGPTWLKQARIAKLVSESLSYRDGRVYGLDAFCIMPNHVHMVMQPLQQADGTFHSLSKIMHSLKGYTGRKANELLGRTGAFWQRESYDHIVRDGGEWERIVHYVLTNPVEADLVENWQDWPWSYCREDTP
jgi:REP element-mobilizing transposase RayT